MRCPNDICYCNNTDGQYDGGSISFKHFATTTSFLTASDVYETEWSRSANVPVNLSSPAPTSPAIGTRTAPRDDADEWFRQLLARLPSLADNEATKKCEQYYSQTGKKDLRKAVTIMLNGGTVQLLLHAAKSKIKGFKLEDERTIALREYNKRGLDSVYLKGIRSSGFI